MWTLQAHTIVEHYIKISSFGLELWENQTFGVGLTLRPSDIIANNRYCCSSMATSGSLKAGSARANSPTGLYFLLVGPSSF